MAVPAGGVTVTVKVTGVPAVGLALGVMEIVGRGLSTTVTELDPVVKSPSVSNAVARTAYDPTAVYGCEAEVGVPGSVWGAVPSPKSMTTFWMGLPFWLAA